MCIGLYHFEIFNCVRVCWAAVLGWAAGLGCVAALAVLPPPSPPAQLFVLCGGQGGAENNVILYTGLWAK